MKRYFLHGLVLAVLGAILFWILLLYRLFSEGFAWLYTSNDGIVVAGILGISGLLIMLVDDIWCGDIPTPTALETKLEWQFSQLQAHIDICQSDIKHGLEIMLEDALKELKIANYTIEKIQEQIDYMAARE